MMISELIASLKDIQDAWGDKEVKMETADGDMAIEEINMADYGEYVRLSDPS